jgi:hypothetical protein
LIAERNLSYKCFRKVAGFSACVICIKAKLQEILKNSDHGFFYLRTLEDPGELHAKWCCLLAWMQSSGIAPFFLIMGFSCLKCPGNTHAKACARG